MAGFWSGFGSTLVKGIDDRQSFAREETSRRQEYLRNVGIPAINKRNQEVDAQVNSILQAESFGLDRAVATSLWEAGTLDVALKQVAGSNDPSKTAGYYNTISKLTDEYKAKAQDPSSIVKKAYGIASKADVSTEEGRQSGLFETLFALDPQATADRNMSNYGLGGYTEADAAEATAGTSRVFSAPAGTAPALAPPERKIITPEQYNSQLNLIKGNIGTITGLSTTTNNTDVILSGNIAPKAIVSAGLATDAFFTLIQAYDVGTANNIILEIASKLLANTNTQNFEAFNAAMTALKKGDTPESILEQIDAATPAPDGTGQPADTGAATTATDGAGQSNGTGGFNPQVQF